LRRFVPPTGILPEMVAGESLRHAGQISTPDSLRRRRVNFYFRNFLLMQTRSAH